MQEAANPGLNILSPIDNGFTKQKVRQAFICVLASFWLGEAKFAV